MSSHEEWVTNTLCLYQEIQLSKQGKLQFFLDKHSTKEGTWGILKIDEGEIDFVFLNGEGEELSRHRINKENPQLMIQPASWHKIILISADFKARLQFYCKPHRYFAKKYALAPAHSDLLYIYQTYLPSQEKLNILDVGCGLGRNPLFLALSGHQVTGIDINEASVQNIRDIAEKEHFSNIKTMVHDLNKPLSLDALYDFIYATVSIQFLNESRVKPLLTELQQLTAPQGMHFLVFPIKAAPFSYPESFTFLAEKNELYHFYQDCGWSVLEYRESVGQLHKLDENGKPVQGLFGLLLAQKLI